MPRFGNGFGFGLQADVGGDGVSEFMLSYNTELSDGTSSPSLNAVLPMTAGPEVDWTEVIDNLNSHVYLSGDTYQITIDDTNSDFRFANGGDKIKIVNVSKCDGLNVTNSAMFQRCTNLQWSAPDSPNITSSSLDSMFDGCEVFNGGLLGWDVSGVTSMVNMFFGAFDYVGTGIAAWSVSNCTNFSQMFFACHDFAEDVGVWDMSSATNISGMFRASNNFNVDVGAWDVSSVQQMNHLFNGTPFNYDLPWDIISATNTHAMFGSSGFNKSLSSWRFDSATDVSWMFAGNTVFNQTVGDGDFPLVTNMSNMFGGASSYDKDHTGWLIPNVSNMATMLDNCGMSRENYDKHLIMCAGQTVQSSVTHGAAGLTYTNGGPGSGGAARSSLIIDDLWTITDGGVGAQNFTTLDSALSMRYTIPTATAAANYNIKASNVYFIDKVLVITGNTANSNNSVIINADGSISWRPDGTATTVSTAAGVVPSNKHAVIEINRTGSTGTIDVNGVEVLNTAVLTGTCTINVLAASSTTYSSGILADVEITVAGTLFSRYKIDDTWVGPTTDLVDYSGNGRTGTAVNIDDDDSELFTLDGIDWDGVERVDVSKTTVATGCTIVSDTLVFDGTQAGSVVNTLYTSDSQPAATIAGVTRIQMTIAGTTTGEAQMYSALVSIGFNTDGDYEEIGISNGTSTSQVVGRNNFDGTVSNISIKRILEGTP